MFKSRTPSSASFSNLINFFVSKPGIYLQVLEMHKNCKKEGTNTEGNIPRELS